MKLLYLLFLCVFSIFYTLSCYIPDQLLGSAPVINNNDNNNNDNEEEDDDDDSTNDRNFCWHRDSCQDTCDSLFRMQTARHQCSELTYREVNTLAEVSDLLDTRYNDSSKKMELGTINPKDLEDINSKDLDLYLQIGFDSFLEAIEGKSRNNRDIINFMKWVAENEDIAKVIAKHDSDYELGPQLFIRMSYYALNNLVDFNFRVSENITSNPDAHYVAFNENNNKEARIDGSHLFNIDTDDFEIREIGNFLAGFTIYNRSLSDDLFLNHADYADNKMALKWGHNTLVSFCESISSGHVKQCLQIVYCAHRFTEDNRHIDIFGPLFDTISSVNDGIFDLMEDREDIFGRTDVRRCSSDELQEEDRFDNLFNPDQSV